MKTKDALKRIELQNKVIWWDMIMFFCWAIVFFISRTAIQFLISFVIILVVCQLFEWLEKRQVIKRYET